MVIWKQTPGQGAGGQDRKTSTYRSPDIEPIDVESQLYTVSLLHWLWNPQLSTHKGEATNLSQVPGWGRCSVFLPMVCAPPRGGPVEKKAKFISGLFFMGQENVLVTHPQKEGTRTVIYPLSHWLMYSFYYEYSPHCYAGIGLQAEDLARSLYFNRRDNTEQCLLIRGPWAGRVGNNACYRSTRMSADSENSFQKTWCGWCICNMDLRMGWCWQRQAHCWGLLVSQPSWEMVTSRFSERPVWRGQDRVIDQCLLLVSICVHGYMPIRVPPQNAHMYPPLTQ